MTDRSSSPAAERAAADLKTLGAVFARFRRQNSARVMAIGLLATIAVRVLASVRFGWSAWDAVAVGIVIALIPFVEWFIHLVVLHAKPRRVRGLLIDPGIGHREHHLQPASVNLVLLRGREAGLFQVMNAGTVVVVVGGPLWLVGAPVAGPILTGIVASVVGLIHYEWSHFIFHVAYRPKTRYYRRLKTNHRLHHWRNEHHWLGVTSNLGDRVMRTYPASKSDVPLSPTAKTLGIDPAGAGEPGRSD